MGLFTNNGNGHKKNNGVAGPPACKTCATSCFGSAMPLGKSFEDFPLQAQQKFEILRQALGETGLSFRNGNIEKAARQRTGLQDKLIEIVNLVPENDFGLLAQTVAQMVHMHSGSPEAENFINSK